MDAAGRARYFSFMTVDSEVPVLGRPRAFCTDAALAAALRVFWTRGYEGASLSELTEAMGINRPSLYAAFGNKEALFRKALDLYERQRAAFMADALDAPTARGVAERFLRGVLALQLAKDGPKGCLLVNTSRACGVQAEAVRDEVVTRLAGAEAALLQRFMRAKTDGDLPDQVEPRALAGYLTAVSQGMAVQAGSGASEADLERLVETTLLVWPGR